MQQKSLASANAGVWSLGNIVERVNARFILLGILALAAALRVPGLWGFPFEQDELYTIIESTELFDSPLHPGIEARPLYYLLQHALFWLTPASAVAVRVLPVVFGMLGIWAVWLLGRRMLGPTAGAAAALFTAVSPWHMYISGMARYPALLFLLSALACLFLLRAYTSERPRDYGAALVCLLLGSLTHPTFLFPVVGIVVGTLCIRNDGSLGWRSPSRQAIKYLWFPYLTALAAGLVLLNTAGREASLRNFSGRSLAEVLRVIPGVVEWMTPVLFAAGVLGALSALLFATNPQARRWGAAATLGIASTLSALFLASFVTNVYADYAASMLPLAFVGAGALVHLIAASHIAHRLWWRLASTATIIAAILPSTVSHFSDGTRFDFRPAFELISDTAPEVMVLTRPIILQQHYAPELVAAELRYDQLFLDEQLAKQRDLWIAAPVQRYGLVYDHSGIGAKWLAEHCRLTFSHARPRLDYRTYRVDLYRCRGRAF
jgi:4-amino-4-deoxy-L-arabinose transferase-like glycosyltransferase